MKKWILYVCVGLMLIVTFGVLASTMWLKQPFRPDEDVAAIIAELQHELIRPNPDWRAIAETRDALRHAWDKVVRRVQFIAERDDILTFTRTTDELRASIIVQDVSMALHRLELLKSIWNEMH